MKEDEYFASSFLCFFEARDGLRDAASTSMLLEVMNAAGKWMAASPFPSQWEESSNSGDH